MKLNHQFFPHYNCLNLPPFEFCSASLHINLWTLRHVQQEKFIAEYSWSNTSLTYNIVLNWFSIAQTTSVLQPSTSTQNVTIEENNHQIDKLKNVNHQLNQQIAKLMEQPKADNDQLNNAQALLILMARLFRPTY